MNIEFYDYGVTAKIIVTCWFWEFRRYCRVVDAALFVAPEVRHQSGGGLLMKTVITGKRFRCYGRLKWQNRRRHNE
ncbi:hypothetical protein [Escherichia coli]|uniref:hypothetical protein n=1 Tax=Escherichia coli TaxID=562 RepID=UPI002FCD592D